MNRQPVVAMMPRMRFLENTALAVLLVGFAACGFPRPLDVPGDDGGVGLDAAADSDGVVCLGSFLNVCVNAPTQSLVITQQTTVDTDRSLMCATAVRGGNYCVIAAINITAFQKVRATGARPLVFLATDTIAIGALVDVGSRHGDVPETGAGSDPGICDPGTRPEQAGLTGGGGAGGSFNGAGGHGGAGGTITAGTPGAAAAAVTALRGGCAGQDGGGSFAAGGHGGGAVYFIAANSIVLHGTVNAGGEGGTGATGSIGGGGGGGGSGGMIGFDAPTIMGDSLITANGGGGGEGISPLIGLTGHDGQDVSMFTTIAARGGSLGDDAGGDGGDGAAGSVAASGKDGIAGVDSGQGEAGGGGGGGGAGLVKAPAHAQLGASVSPPPTP